MKTGSAEPMSVDLGTALRSRCPESSRAFYLIPESLKSQQESEQSLVAPPFITDQLGAQLTVEA
jgi:hypothetical protein